MIEEKTDCKELKDAIVTLRRLSGSELQQAIFEAEMDAKRVQNAEISTAKEEGIKEGEIKKAIEDVIAFAKTDMSLKLICQTLNVSENIKRQAIKKLNEMGVKYFD